MVEVDSDSWPLGEKRQHCANCAKTRGVNCNRKKRVGIGFCRDWKAKDEAFNGGKQ